MKGRTFTAAELARILKTQAHEPDYTIDLGEGFKAVQMAEHSGLVFNIERNGHTHALAGADAAELAEISEILWAEFGPPMNTLDDLLTPDELRDKPDPLAGTPEGLTPDALREMPDPAAGTIEGLLTPDDLK